MISINCSKCLFMRKDLFDIKCYIASHAILNGSLWYLTNIHYSW